jgi:hypothetical protein
MDSTAFRTEVDALMQQRYGIGCDLTNAQLADRLAAGESAADVVEWVAEKYELEPLTESWGMPSTPPPARPRRR